VFVLQLYSILETVRNAANAKGPLAGETVGVSKMMLMPGVGAAGM
jgi:hypothetical protein